MPSKHEIRVRYAPSPTGPFHIGGARTALFNWAFVRREGGAFILRIEDSDPARSKKKYESEIIESLNWLGVLWDEGPGVSGKFGPYRQSERLAIYKKYLEKLLAEKKAYFCYCTKEELEAERQSQLVEGFPPKYGGRCRNLTAPPPGKKPEVIRFKTPETNVFWTDMIRGKVSFDASLFGDFVIAKDIKSIPLYNFSVVIDDHEMKISHVIRGEDHISNTPKQLLLISALEFETPHYAHLPLVLSADRKKLSKRFAETSVIEYRKMGYLPEAVVNFLMLLGWHPAGDREIFSPEEIIKVFDIKRAQKGGAIFNPEKLDWLNREHIKMAPLSELQEIIAPILAANEIKTSKEFLAKIIETERGRMKKISDFWPAASFFFNLPDYPADMLISKDDGRERTFEIMKKTLAVFENLGRELLPETVSRALESLISEYGRSSVLWPLRVALSGLEASPDPYDIIGVLGLEESINRVKTALEKLEK